ncbi:hypothetical protein AHF37_08817 [Paragonimus kellicotti]|nr:hypothetical protein AHF37_08817 [Paragonimus kellicotti]
MPLRLTSVRVRLCEAILTRRHGITQHFLFPLFFYVQGVCLESDRVFETPSVIKLAHLHSLVVLAWGEAVNCPEKRAQLAAMGVDGIIYDRLHENKESGTLNVFKQEGFMSSTSPVLSSPSKSDSGLASASNVEDVKVELTTASTGCMIGQPDAIAPFPPSTTKAPNGPTLVAVVKECIEVEKLPHANSTTTCDSIPCTSMSDLIPDVQSLSVQETDATAVAINTDHTLPVKSGSPEETVTPMLTDTTMRTRTTSSTQHAGVCLESDRVFETPSVIKLAHLHSLVVLAWGEAVNCPEKRAQLAAMGVDGIIYDRDRVFETPSVIKLAHLHSLVVLAWGEAVNCPEKRAQLAAMGVDGIIYDRLHENKESGTLNVFKQEGFMSSTSPVLSSPSKSDSGLASASNVEDVKVELTTASTGCMIGQPDAIAPFPPSTTKAPNGPTLVAVVKECIEVEKLPHANSTTTCDSIPCTSMSDLIPDVQSLSVQETDATAVAINTDHTLPVKSGSPEETVTPMLTDTTMRTRTTSSTQHAVPLITLA